METIQFKVTCPKCGGSGFKPDDAKPQDLAEGKISCASCGHVLSIQDVQELKAAIVAGRGPQDPVSVAVAQSVRDLLKLK